MPAEAHNWLSRNAATLLRRAGLQEGQTVLDFGCHDGNYTIPASMVVGPEGKVYGYDKDKDKLRDLSRAIRKKRGAVDVVLLYDVLHRGYFPEQEERDLVLKNIHRVLRPGGCLSCYLTHLKQYGMTYARLILEIETAGFSLSDEAKRTLVHDESVVRGRVFSFTRG